MIISGDFNQVSFSSALTNSKQDLFFCILVASCRKDHDLASVYSVCKVLLYSLLFTNTDHTK